MGRQRTWEIFKRNTKEEKMLSPETYHPEAKTTRTVILLPSLLPSPPSCLHPPPLLLPLAAMVATVTVTAVAAALQGKRPTETVFRGGGAHQLGSFERNPRKGTCLGGGGDGGWNGQVPGSGSSPHLLWALVMRRSPPLGVPIPSE